MNRPRRLARHIPRLAILLIAGVLTTIVVAAAGSWRTAHSRYSGTEFRTENSESSPLYVLRRMLNPAHSFTHAFQLRRTRQVSLLHPSEVRSATDSRAYAPADPTLRGASWHPPLHFRGHFVDTWIIVEAGWPCRSAWGWTLTVDPLSLLPENHILRWPQRAQEKIVRGGLFSIRDSNAGATPIEVPYLPLWRGLILNTLFYAAIWWALLALPRLIRRTLRSRRGLCPRCAYDMRGLTDTPCPECGDAPKPLRASHALRAEPPTPIALDRGR